MRERIIQRHAEQRLGMEQRSGKEGLQRPLRQDGGQDERIKPQDETADQAMEYAPAAGARPVEREQHGRQKLKGGRERHQADIGQLRAAVDQPVIAVGAEQQAADGQPPDPEDQIVQVRAL